MITPAMSERRFDRLVSVLSGWMVGGVFLDGWGHHHGATESFFTPWHFALYSGYAALAAVIVGFTLLRRRQGITPAIPPGYRMSFWGAVLFFAGGTIDGFWHSIFGIEHKVEAFISPPHMLLFVSGVMTVLGPISALKVRPIAAPRWSNSWPAVLAVAYAVGLMQFATEHANALLIPAMTGEDLAYAGPLGPHGHLPYDMGVGWGLSAIMVQSAMIAGALVLLISRLRRPPMGSVTVVLLVGVGHSLIIHNALWQLLAVLAAGVVGDLLVPVIAAGRRPLSVLTAAVPAALTATWVAELMVQYTLHWTVHLLTGAVLTALVSGLLVGAVATLGVSVQTAAADQPATPTANRDKTPELI